MIAMSPRQKSTLLLLALANIVLLCCGTEIALLLLTTPPDQNPWQPVLDAYRSAPPSSAPTAALAVTPTLEAGWKLYTVPTDTFALALPPAWKSLPLDPATVAAALGAIGEKNPEFSDALGASNTSAASLVKFIAVDTAPDGSVGTFSTNINVFHRTQPIAAPLQVYIPISLKALQDLPYAGRPILHRRVQTLAGEAEEFRYTNTLKLINDANVTTANRQYLLVRGKELYILSCSAPLKAESRYVPLFEKIAASFRWIGN
jgi:hypothetical protein